MKDKILVASWGYSMVLTTWVKVINETQKTLLVQEIESRGLTEEEYAEKKLKPSYMQCYTVAVDKPRVDCFDRVKHIRLYKRETSSGEIEYITAKDGYRLYFKEWNGEPQFEDHCD